MAEYKSYFVWDAGTRWFHGINMLCVFALMIAGFIILNASVLDVSTAGKIQLKTIHVWIGYVFALNLAWRFIWAFIGNRYARWRSILPGGRGYFVAAYRYVVAFVSSKPEQYVGHNPLGRLAVTVMLLLLAVQGVTGLVLAGTDMFMAPIGYWIAQWVAAPGISPDTLLPYASEMYDEVAYESMRAFRKPFVVTHLYCFYVLVIVVAIHIAAVIITDIKEGGSIISAIFTGRKIIHGQPVDKGD